VRHAFRVVSPQARFVAFTAAAGAGALFGAMDRELAGAPTSPEALRALATRHGVSAGSMTAPHEPVDEAAALAPAT